MPSKNFFEDVIGGSLRESVVNHPLHVGLDECFEVAEGIAVGGVRWKG